jgi:uncharacterized alpha/beta hydrolase family protein
MKKVFFILIVIVFVAIAVISCKKEGQCRCQTDVVGIDYIEQSIATKKECKEFDKSHTMVWCKWEIKE